MRLYRLLAWQPSRFLTDRAEAQRAFALAEQLDSVSAAATQLGTTWPSLRKAFTRHGFGMPARNPKAVGQRRSPRPARAPASRPLRRWTRCLSRSTRRRSRRGRGRQRSFTSGSAATRSTPSWAPTSWSKLNSESRGRQPATRAWAIIRRADRAHHRHENREQRSQRRQADRASRPDRPQRQEEMVADARCPIHPDQLGGEQRFRADLAAYLDSLPVPKLAELLGSCPAAASSRCSSAC